jgi:histidinol dehydrogenase
MYAGSIKNHRERETGLLVYPVYSRRSQGLSLGINLFPDRKRCSFDCPYCEVFPFKSNIRFSLNLMKTQLQEALTLVKTRGIEARDICFSGNGEPTMSPDFRAALEEAFRIRDDSAPETKVVVITNGTGLLDNRMFELLRQTAAKGLKVWLKADAGTEAWYRAMNRSQTPYQALRDKIRAFTSGAPATIQTMRCMVNGVPPAQEEEEAWESLVTELADGTMLEAVHIYGKARPAPEDPLTESLPSAELERYGQSLKKRLESAGLNPAVQVFP